MFMKIKYINHKQLEYVIPNYFYGEEYDVEDIYIDKISIITDIDNYYNDINIDFSKGEESLAEYKRITDLYTKDIDVRFIKIKGLIRSDNFLITTNKEIRKKYRIKKFIYKSNIPTVQENFDWVTFNRDLQINNLLNGSN
jgi:hypothetical protein